jgi:hypothetical protein
MKREWRVVLTAASAARVFACLEAPAAEQEIAREVVSLDGTWEIIFDPQNTGREAGWQKTETFTAAKARERIRVPSCWEEFRQDYEGVAFEAGGFLAGTHSRMGTGGTGPDCANGQTPRNGPSSIASQFRKCPPASLSQRGG